jgi:hypothetical protein
VADRVILSIYQASAYGMLRDQVEVLVIASVSFGIIVLLFYGYHT